MEVAESRFAKLLKPIRELTENWAVDLASQLEDYLQELEGLRISFDGGKTSMNFAEAALLLQGTSSIYGKKVELLHRLVFQTLDYISNKNKKKDKMADSEAGEEGAEEMVTPAQEEHLQEELKSEETNANAVTLHTEPVMVEEIAPVPPEALIPVDALEKQDFPSINVRGEVMGSWKDFRMNVFPVDKDGRIQMGMGAFRSYFLRSFCEDSQAPPLMDMPHLHPDIMERSDVGERDVGMGIPEVEGPEQEMSGFVPLECNEMESMNDGGPDEHIERQQGVSERRMLRERPAVEPAAPEPKQQKETVDLWKWHDLYSVVGEDKPLSKGRFCNVPAGLEESGKRKRKPSSKPEDFVTWCTKAFKVSDRKLKHGPSFPEFNYIYLSKMKERVKARRDILKRTGIVMSDDQLRRTYLEEEEEDKEKAQDHEDLRHQEPEGDEMGDGAEDFAISFSPEDREQQEHDIGLPNPAVEELTYEELVKKSMAQFLANTERYVRATPLSERVEEWELLMKPQLIAEEERGVFDIRDYGERIINAFSHVQEKKPFASIVSGKDNHEVCRYLLASLQLANDYTVEISTEGKTLDETVDTMALVLLSQHRAHDRLRAYNANTDMEVHGLMEALS